VRRHLDDALGRIALAAAFVAVHAVLIVLLWTDPHAPFNDVIGVYRDWVAAGVETGRWVGIAVPFVYPPLALAPMLVAGIAGVDAGAYGWAWLGLVVLLDAVAVLVLASRGDRGARRRGVLAAWWWLAFLLLTGPVALARLEAITAPIAIIAVRLLLERPAIAGALLAAAAWMKIWPGALLAAAVVTLRARWRVLASGLLATAAVLLLWLALGSRGELLGFLTGQTARSLQVESLLAAPWLVAVALGAPGAEIVWNQELITFEVSGPGVAELAAWSTPLLLLGAIVVLLLGVLARRGGALAALTLTSLGLAAVLVVTNKVGSPQFTVWLAAPVVLAILLARRRGSMRDARASLPAVIGLVIAGLTQLVYPSGYDLLLEAQPLMVLVLLVKHVLWLVLLGWSLAGLVRLARER